MNTALVRRYIIDWLPAHVIRNVAQRPDLFPIEYLLERAKQAEKAAAETERVLREDFEVKAFHPTQRLLYCEVFGE